MVSVIVQALTLPFVVFAVFVASCGGDDGPGPGPTPTPPPGTPGPTATPPAQPSVRFERFAEGFTRPVFVTHAGDQSGRLFVVEKPGVIRAVKDRTVAQTPFLDIKSLVNSGGNEQGLLGLAFHPRFRENGRFFVAFTAKDGANTVMEFASAPGAASAKPDPVKTLFAIPDSRTNHNGGMLAFGPDGFLYISTGDGGGAGDPDRTAQDLGSLLGKILRVDVDRGDPYGIPSSNPFANNANARKEVWAYGLRNPWRFSFDRGTGDLWIADVGQNEREEVDFQPGSSGGGQNYGWSITEGTRCFRPTDGCSKDGQTLPVFETKHDDGACSITGGYVYRGSIAGLRGRYIFTDYCDETVRTLTRGADGRFTPGELGAGPPSIGSFGEDEAGELYLASDGGGAIFRMAAR